MGIKDFKKVFKNHGELSLKQLKGLTLAIDAMGEIYRGVLGTSKVDQLTDKSGNPTNYIGVLIGVIRNFYLADVKQIWVFDSPTPHPLKIVLADRSQKREKAEKTLTDMGVADGEAKNTPISTITMVETKVKVNITDGEEDPMFAIPEGYVVMDNSDDDDNSDVPLKIKDTKYTKTKDKKKHQLQKQAFRITSQMIHNVQRILDGFDIPYIIAPPGIEAEHVAAQLTQIGKADAVFTNDHDALLFGAVRIIMRNRDKKVKKSKYTEFIEYHLGILLEDGLTRRDLAKVAVVLGCDFYSDKNDPTDDDDARPYFKGIGAKSVLGKLKNLERRKVFEDPMVAKAMDVYFAEVPPYEIKNESSLQNKKGARPFYSSKKISSLVTWLVDDLGFESKPLVKRFRETFGLEKIKYKKHDKEKTSRQSHPNDPFVGKNLEYAS